MRDRLIELIKQADDICSRTKQCEECVGMGKGQECINHLIADHLLANGVIVPPCKVGDKVYVLDEIVWAYECRDCPYFEEGWYDDPHECRKTKNGRKHHDCIKIDEHIVTQQDIYSYLCYSLFGKTVFLTREEAEKALKGGEGK